MKATITVNMDNAAFEEPKLELARILNDLADKLAIFTTSQCFNLHDINGNTVGQLKITGKR